MSTPVHVLRKWFEAFAKGDMDSAGALLTEDAELHIDNPAELAGTYSGLDEFLNFYFQKRQLAGDSFKYEVIDMLEGQRHAAAVLLLSAERDGQRQEWGQLALYRIEAGRIEEMWFFEPLSGIGV